MPTTIFSPDTLAFIPKDYITDYTVKEFTRQGRAISRDDTFKHINELINIDTFLTPSKRIILEKIYSDAWHVAEILLPMKQLGFLYSLDLTGGAVRDFVLNQENSIKDLDFMVQILPYSRKNVADAISHIPLLAKLDIDLTSNYYLSSEDKQSIDVLLLSYCLEKNFDNSEVLENKTRNYTIFKSYGDNANNVTIETNRQERLSCVVKLDNTNTNYPIDLLVTDFSKPEFIEAFDFDICKASFAFINPYYAKNFPKDVSHLVSRFVAPPSFFADFHNKKISINADDMSENQISRSICSHLPRILSKYPDFSLNLIGTAPIQRKQVETILFKDTLSKSLDKQDFDNPKKKEESKILKV